MNKVRISDLPEETTPLGGMARTLANRPDLRLVVLRVPAGQRVAEHNAPADVVFIALTGRGVVHAGSDETVIMAGEMVSCPAGVTRAISAVEADLELLVIRTPNP